MIDVLVDAHGVVNRSLWDVAIFVEGVAILALLGATRALPEAAWSAEWLSHGLREMGQAVGLCVRVQEGLL